MVRLGGGAFARYIAFVKATSTVVYEPADALDRLRAAHPCIITFWHGQFMMIPAFSPPDIDVRVMVARHGDAELIGEVVARHGMELIRGAGAGTRRRDRGGAAALRAALDSLEDGWSVSMTAEVPPGPARQAGPGIVTLSRLSSRPIVPVAVASSRFRAFDTWSRLTINMPYSRIGVVVGDPIYVEATAGEPEREAARRAVQQELDRVTRRAYLLAGGDLERASPASLDPAAPPEPLTRAFKLYRVATRLLTPAAPALLAFRARQGKEDPARRRERLGHPSRPRPDGELIWVHAASVGETNAVLPLIARIQAERRGLAILLTTGTTTSAAVAAARLPEGVIHQYVPLDAPAVIRRFLDHWRPSLVVLTESEIWPNTLVEAAERAIPVVIVNARMSQRSYQRWRRNRRSARALFGRLRLVLAQNEPLLRRFRELGARDVRDVGNLKIDSPPLPVDEARLTALRNAMAGRPVLLAASTHAGEEEIVLEAHRLLSARIAGLITIIAPRHPDRGDDVMALVAHARLACRRRSTGELPCADTEVYVADTIGELGAFYSLAQVALIGGSLIDRGGQNPIEAVRFGTVVLTGPSVGNFADAYGELTRRGGAVVVGTAAELAEVAGTLFGAPDELERRRAAGSAALARLAGSLERTCAALLELMPRAAEVERAD
ncbi:MAG: glycosyltransferase N-terminal domain-containing protein [Hyphomicrobiaceae bacterium]